MLGGHGHEPWLSVEDRCGPMRRRTSGTAGEDEAGTGVAAMAISLAGG